MACILDVFMTKINGVERKKQKNTLIQFWLIYITKTLQQIYHEYWILLSLRIASLLDVIEET